MRNKDEMLFSCIRRKAAGSKIHLLQRGELQSVMHWASKSNKNLQHQNFKSALPLLVALGSDSLVEGE
jgi:hypothetical protein